MVVVDDPRRVDAALMRSTYTCLVVGHAPALTMPQHRWAALLRGALCAARTSDELAAARAARALPLPALEAAARA